MLRSRPIKSERTAEDGIRISVMSRHTLPDGATQDPEIDESMYDEWWPELAPPPKLVGDYYKRQLSWVDFAERYLVYIRSPEVQPMVRRLALLALTNLVTIMCIEDTPERCHRRLLARECLELEPTLELYIH